jgi:hypothetical protein
MISIRVPIIFAPQETAQPIFSALVAAIALAASLALYDSHKPDTEMARHPNEARERAIC